MARVCGADPTRAASFLLPSPFPVGFWGQSLELGCRRPMFEVTVSWASLFSWLGLRCPFRLSNGTGKGRYLWLSVHLCLDLLACLITHSCPLGSQRRSGCLWRARHPWTAGKEHFSWGPSARPMRPLWSQPPALASNLEKRCLCSAGMSLGGERETEAVRNWGAGTKAVSRQTWVRPRFCHRPFE